MHLHDNAVRADQHFPIRSRADEVFQTDGGQTLAIDRIVERIHQAPEEFERADVTLRDFAQEIRGRTKLNFHYVASMERANARRPLLVGRRDDGTLFLLDGRHRAARAIQLGYDIGEAWILSPAQLSHFTV